MMGQIKAAKQKLENHPFWGLILMVLLTFILTWIIPAGEYSRYVDSVTGRTLVDPDSFQYVERNPAGLGDLFTSFYYGFVNSASVMAAVSFVGGAFGVLKGIGVMNAAVSALTDRLKRKPFWVFAAVVMVVVAVFNGFTGFRELDVVFVAMVIPVCLKMGYDTMTAAGIVLVGSAAGFACAMANPFFTGIAQEIAELPMYSAMWYRAIMTFVFLGIGLVYVNAYAKKVKDDPAKSLSLAAEESAKEKFLNQSSDEQAEKALTAREKAAGIAFIGLFIYMIYGCIAQGFGFAQVAGVFFAAAIVTGIVAGRSLNEICYMFPQGIQDILVAIYIILFARAILVLMEESLIIDTVVHFLSQFVIGGNTIVASVVMFILQCFINFFVPSGSGQAVITMPIMVPLADMGNVTRQVACLASQLGDGITNYIYPTNGGLLAVLSVAGLSYKHWFKFAWKIIGLFVILCGVFVALAQMIQLT